MNVEKHSLDRPGTDLRWWLTLGAECCYFCEAQVHAEALAYCVACDQPVCPVCWVSTDRSRAVLCPDCAHDEWRARD